MGKDRDFMLTALAPGGFADRENLAAAADLLPNDRYPLDREVFRLYYTSECEDQQSIDIYFEDNSEPAQLFQLTFDFNNETEDEDTVVTSSGEELPVVVSQ